MSHWGSSKLSGRGLVALVGKGQIFQVVLEAGEEFIIHPNNLLAYSKNTPLLPQIYRIPSNSFRLQVPRFKYSLPRINFGREFFRNMTQTDTWKAISKLVWTLQMWSRRIIWGERVQKSPKVTPFTVSNFSFYFKRNFSGLKGLQPSSFNPEQIGCQTSSLERMSRMSQLRNQKPLVG